jgi:hypothetical protein
MERDWTTITVETSLDISIGYLRSPKVNVNKEICVFIITIAMSIEYFKNIIINKSSIYHTRSIIKLDEWAIITDVEWSEAV